MAYATHTYPTRYYHIAVGIARKGEKMGNRILKESICTSEDVNRLTPMAEILFYRLLVKADDYGAYHGNPAIIKGTCFPLKSDEITCTQVKSWLSELVAAGLIDPYQAEGRDYIQFHKWKAHQQIRALKRKYPEPDIICNQLISDDSKCPRNPIQSNTETNTTPKWEEEEKEVFYPQDKTLFLVWCRERQISDDFASSFFDRYAANGWRDGSGEQIRNWMNFLLEAWRKAKGTLPPPPSDTLAAIRERREREAQHSYTLNDCVEWPPGSGEYVGRDEWEALQHG